MGEYSMEFIRAVAHLRGIAPWYRALALHAADHWTDQEFMDRMATVPVPGDAAAGAGGETAAARLVPGLTNAVNS